MSWSWAKIGDKSKLADVLDPRMKTLENDLGLREKTMTSQDVVRTTDATVTVLHAEKIPVDTSVVVLGYVVARRTGGSSGTANDGAGYRVEFVAKNDAGTAALIGAGVITVLGESQAAWNVTLDASGGTIRVKVAGALQNNVTWGWCSRALPDPDV